MLSLRTYSLFLRINIQAIGKMRGKSVDLQRKVDVWCNVRERVKGKDRDALIHHAGAGFHNLK